MGNRFDILEDKFTEALNRVFIVFYDAPEVITALKGFHEVTLGVKTPELSNQKLLELFKAMLKNVAINPYPLTDTFFLQAFNVKNEGK
jgi:hypothetical protein